MPKLRVAHLITQLELGGAQQNTLYTVSHLDPERFEPVLVSGPGGILDEDAKALGVPIEWIPALGRSLNPFKDPVALVRLYQTLRRLRPHVVHTHSSKAGILGRLAAYVAGVPIIIHTFHGFGFTPGQPAWLRRQFINAERFCARLSQHLIFVARDNQEEAKTLGIGPTVPSSLIRSGIAVRAPELPAEIRRELGIPESAWLVISVGNFKPQKNPLDLIRVAAAALQKNRELHFLFTGDGELRAASEKAAADAGIQDRVHFLGWRRDIPALLRASNTFLLTSLWEGLPRAILEASVAGLPTVAYGVNGVRDILKDGENGFLIPTGDSALAAEKVLWLAAHAEQARSMGRMARLKIQQEYDIDFMVRQQEALYTTCYANVPLKEFYGY